MARKPLSKKTRFEVFKRDKFTCQYCGMMAPDVILEVDHIVPVSEGGGDNLLNLITSCRDCNRGKGKIRLSDDEVLKKQQKELLDLADKKEQLQMMVEWKKELLNIRDSQVDYIDSLIEQITGWGLTDHGKRIIAKYLLKFPFETVNQATEIAFDRYYIDNGTEYQQNKAFNDALNKIGGICYNKMNEGQ